LKAKLKHIADIQTGFYAKNPVTKGEVVYLQAKHFNQNGILTSDLHPDLLRNSVSDKHLLMKGDVLFAAKGTRNFASAYKGLEIPAVASTSFFVIRLHEQSILSEYLAWFLNYSDAQKILKSFARGTSIVSISKDVLEDLIISIPSIKTQHTVLKITELREKEISLEQQIFTLREQQIQQQIINALK
jgi:restriction endonuclease S subunit